MDTTFLQTTPKNHLHVKQYKIPTLLHAGSMQLMNRCGTNKYHMNPW